MSRPGRPTMLVGISRLSSLILLTPCVAKSRLLYLRPYTVYYSTVQYHERNAKKLFDNTVQFAALQYTPVQEHILLCHGQVTDLQCTVHGYRCLLYYTCIIAR